MPDQRDRGSMKWPAEVERTPETEREPYPHNFSTPKVRAFKNVLEELDRMDAQDVELWTAGPQRADAPHLPYRDATPADPGVVVYWKMGGDQYVAPCDRWDNLRDNAQAIAKHLEAMRGTERWGVKTVQGRFEAQALPPGDEDGSAVALGPQEEPHEVLGIDPDAPDEVVEGAARGLKARHHPDGGEEPDEEQYVKVQKAKEAMLDA